jgi:hypothetical protein
VPPRDEVYPDLQAHEAGCTSAGGGPSKERLGGASRPTFAAAFK